MEVIWRLIKYFENLISRYNAAVDHGEAWKRNKIEPLRTETASELKRRSSDA